jgi:hypothetical protein
MRAINWDGWVPSLDGAQHVDRVDLEETTIAVSQSLDRMMRSSAHRWELKDTTMEVVGHNDSDLVALRWPKAGEHTG